MEMERNFPQLGLKLFSYESSVGGRGCRTEVNRTKKSVDLFQF